MTHLLLLLQLSTSSAFAQSAEEPPLAIPASGEAPAAAPTSGPPRQGPPRDGAFGPPPPMSAAQLQALTQYREQRLSVRPETELHGGGAVVVGGGYGGMYRPGPYGGVHVGWAVPGVVLSDPVTAEQTWAVYQGPTRLDAPEFLRAAGETGRADALDRDIKRAKRASAAWLGVAGAGAVMAVTGVMGLGVTGDPDINRMYNNLMVGGAGVAAVGLVGSSFPSARARELSHDLPASISLAEAQAMAAKHNDALRQQLGLSPAEVWGVESQAR